MIPHNKPTLGIEEIAACERVITSGWIAQGKEVKAFEDEFCAFLGLPEGCAVAVSSGTAALYLSLWALGAKEKKIAFPVYVCSALRNAVGMVGGRECLIDNAPDSPNISVEKLNEADATIAIVPHTYGIPVDVKKIKNKLIIEDSCQSLGAKIDEKHTGTMGKVGIFSFYATKLITSGGQGGMVVSTDKALADEIRDYREFDQRRDRKVRFNFQMTDVQAAIGREQLKKLPAFLEKRKEIFNKYRDAKLPLLVSTKENIKPIFYRAVLNTSIPQIVKDKCKSAGIATIIPLEDWELLGEKHEFPEAHKLTQSTLSIPIYPCLSKGQTEIIIANIKEIINI